VTPRTREILLRVVALVGLAVSSLLLVDYLGEPLVCGAGGCGTVRESRFASILGLPTPAFGVALFGAALVLSLIPRRWARGLLAVAGAAGALAGVAFLVIQIAVLKAICPYCVVADVAGILLGVLSLTTRTVPALGRRALALSAGAAILAAGLPAGARLLRARPPEGLPEMVWREQRDGVATIVAFLDFECPVCRKEFEQVELLKKEFPDRLRVVRKHLPLDRIHPHARSAARASCCADELGHGEKMAEALFRVPAPMLAPEGCEGIAQKIGIDLTAYKACMLSDRPDRRIADDEAEAARLQLRSVPVFWVGTEMFRGKQQDDVMRESIKRALARSS
jgi:uncharacterized membrane protein/predicted DsbA family dithiol-disulfide isomerase